MEYLKALSRNVRGVPCCNLSKASPTTAKNFDSKSEITKNVRRFFHALVKFKVCIETAVKRTRDHLTN